MLTQSSLVAGNPSSKVLLLMVVVIGWEGWGDYFCCCCCCCSWTLGLLTWPSSLQCNTASDVRGWQVLQEVQGNSEGCTEESQSYMRVSYEHSTSLTALLQHQHQWCLPTHKVLGSSKRGQHPFLAWKRWGGNAVACSISDKAASKLIVTYWHLLLNIFPSIFSIW